MEKYKHTRCLGVSLVNFLLSIDCLHLVKDLYTWQKASEGGATRSPFRLRTGSVEVDKSVLACVFTDRPQMKQLH